jgi:hypothetical protein
MKYTESLSGISTGPPACPAHWSASHKKEIRFARLPFDKEIILQTMVDIREGWESTTFPTSRNRDRERPISGPAVGRTLADARAGHLAGEVKWSPANSMSFPSIPCIPTRSPTG